MNRIPHTRIVVAVSFLVLFVFAAVTVYVLRWTEDEVTKGAVIGVWITSAGAVVNFWLGSSSGGKAKPDPETPRPVEVVNSPDDPVPTTPTRSAFSGGGI